MEPDFVEECLSVLTRRPATLDALLGDLPDARTAATSRPFEPFDREAQIRERDGKSLPALLQEFADSRLDSIARLRAMHLTPEKLELKGMHPGLGIVTARQLMATWTAHDLGHLLQISRVMAKRYKQEVGPWASYLSVMK